MQKASPTLPWPVVIEYATYTAEMGFTRKEMIRFEMAMLASRRFEVLSWRSSWSLMVLTTIRLQNIPTKASVISRKTANT